MDNVIARLASSQGISSTEPNKQLAREIVAAKDKDAVKTLAEHLGDKNKRIQSDCIKTLYEVGEQAPELIAPYAAAFIKLLDDRNNRMVWGAMTALRPARRFALHNCIR